MRLVEDEHQLGFVEVTHLGQRGEQIGEHPHQKCGEQHGTGGLVTEFEQRDDALPGRVDAHQITRFELRFTEERVSSLGFQIDQSAKYHPGGRRGHRAQRFELWLAVVADQIPDHRAQILEVQQRQALLVGPVEDQPERRFLSLVQSQHLRQQDRTETGDRGAHRHPDPGCAQRQELHRKRLRRPAVAGVGGPRGDLVTGRTGARQSGQVTLHVGHHHRHTSLRELLGDHLQ